MSLKTGTSLLQEILNYVYRHMEGVTRSQVAREFGISYYRSTHRLEFLSDYGLITRIRKELKYPFFEYVYTPLRKPRVGVSVTFNQKTGGEGKPTLDITLTVQVGIDMGDTKALVTIDRLAERWFNNKFENVPVPIAAYDRFTLTIENSKRLEKTYDFSWRWMRIPPPGTTNEESLSGNQPKWEDIPIGVSSYRGAHREGRIGRPRGE